MKYIPMLVISLALLFSGCTTPTSKTIVGRWRFVEEDTQFVEFFPDGTVSNAEGDVVKWIILDDGRLQIESIMEDQKVHSVMEVSFDEDKMIWTSPKGIVIESMRDK